MSDDETTTFDMDAAAQSIADDLWSDPAPKSDAADAADAELGTDSPPEPPTDQAAAPLTGQDAPPAAPAVRPAPNSWAAEMREHWGKIDPKVQEYVEKREQDFHKGLEQYKSTALYGKTVQDVIAPFQPILDQQGVDAPRAVQTLLQAHMRLTQGPDHARQAAYEELGRTLGLSPTGDGQAAAPIDPTVKALQDRLYSIESSWTAQQQATLQEAKARTAKEVDAFAADPAHAYFDAVAPDMVRLIKTGLPLQDAYEQAVWLNPVTRQKEIARVQTDTEAKLKENARLEALPKRRAAGVNVNGRDSARAPTEPLGTMDDTMRSTLAEIRSRV
jgi:hypothetical protein